MSYITSISVFLTFHFAWTPLVTACGYIYYYILIETRLLWLWVVFYSLHRSVRSGLKLTFKKTLFLTNGSLFFFKQWVTAGESLASFCWHIIDLSCLVVCMCMHVWLTQTDFPLWKRMCGSIAMPPTISTYSCGTGPHLISLLRKQLNRVHISIQVKFKFIVKFASVEQWLKERVFQ